ncbi:hypothetical protein BX666DRAFT_1253808 [Dichotomocladium elegans]|nr:hypothetical protein BX666DRAFT_1253808 [Dichotomocladium elegans]
MRKLKALLANEHSRQLPTAPQLLRALKQKVAHLSVASEAIAFGSTSQYSTGFCALDQYLCGGFYRNHAVEITGLTKATNTKVSIYIMESFLHSYPTGIVHYISTTGMIGLREIEATITQAQKKHKRQDITMMERIQCYTVFTAHETSNLLVQIGARQLLTSVPGMIVMNDVVHLLESEWNTTSEQSTINALSMISQTNSFFYLVTGSSMANDIKSLRSVDLSFLIIHSTTGNPKTTRPWMIKAQGLVEQWDMGIDVRLMLIPRRQSGVTCKVLKARAKVAQTNSTMQLDW